MKIIWLNYYSLHRKIFNVNEGLRVFLYMAFFSSFFLKYIFINWLKWEEYKISIFNITFVIHINKGES